MALWAQSTSAREGRRTDGAPSSEQAEPVIDPEAWSVYMVPLGETAGQVVELWLSALDSRVAAIRDATGSQDASALTAAAHTLVGSATYVGAARLAGTCRLVERLAIHGARWDFVEAVLPGLLRDADDARQALVAAIA